MQAISVTNKVVTWDAIQFNPDFASELRDEGWVDDLDMGLGRNNEGPLPRGWVRQDDKALCVFPGDYVLRRIDEAGAIRRAVYDPGSLESQFNVELGGVTPATPIDPSDTKHPDIPIAAAHQPEINTTDHGLGADPSGADVQNIQQDSEWTTRVTGDAPVETPPENEPGPNEGGGSTNEPPTDVPVEPVFANPADDPAVPPTDVPTPPEVAPAAPEETAPAVPGPDEPPQEPPHEPLSTEPTDATQPVDAPVDAPAAPADAAVPTDMPVDDQSQPTVNG